MATKKKKAHAKKQETSDLGTNRTGVQASPLDSAALASGAEGVTADPRGARSLALVRAELSQQAPPLGTMPVPATLKGVAKTALQALKGNKATVFLDQLGERLAFERTGVRLYEAVLAKLPASATGEGTFSTAELRRIRDEELAHLHLVKEALEELGADPTAQTPDADAAGVRSLGLVQSVTDPRTTLTQCLETLLVAELADNDGWKLLIALAEAAGLDDLAGRFTNALLDEDRHLQDVRRWLAERLEVQLGKPLPSTDFGEPAQPG